MSNWATGYIEIEGKPKDVENFCKLFIFEEEKGKKGLKQEKYFARSFVQSSWKEFKKEYFGDITTEKKWDIGFLVDFAWSCHSCMFDGYPTAKDNKECVTLEWAMKKYNVNVEIEVEEEGVGFEEKITTKDKIPIYESKEMPEYTCQKCGSDQHIPSSYEPSDEACYECGEFAWKDELTEMVKEKLEKIKNGNN